MTYNLDQLINNFVKELDNLDAKPEALVLVVGQAGFGKTALVEPIYGKIKEICQDEYIQIEVADDIDIYDYEADVLIVTRTGLGC